MSNKRSEPTLATDRPETPAPAKEKPAGQKPFCFVIGPIDAEGTELRRRSNMLLKYIIKPALEGQYYVKRADEDPRPGSITDQMILDIERADLVVADLSNLNPNAFYELGAAHALAKKVIHMCDSTTTLPFDIHDYRSVFFDPMDPDRHDETIGKLKAAAEALQSEYPLNPISRALGRHEAIQREDAKRASIEQMFGDIDRMKQRLRDIEHQIGSRKPVFMANKGRIAEWEQSISAIPGVRSAKMSANGMIVSMEDGLDSQARALIRQRVEAWLSSFAPEVPVLIAQF